MNRKFAASVCLVALFCAGCSTVGISGGDLRTVRVGSLDKGRSKEQQEEDRRVEEALKQAMAVCDRRLSSFEASSRTQRKWALGVYLTGLVAGSIVVPALAAANASANAATIAGLSGLAGASGLTGKALESTGLGGAADAETRNEIAAKVREQVKIAITGANEEQVRMGAVAMIAAECSIYSIKVPSTLASDKP